MKIARKFSWLISVFPFIRCVMLSGSISKGMMKPDSDIDFFIITAPNRLWIARTSLVLFKRLFLFNSRKYFCVNYFIDTENLEIEEKNIFTAIESATLIPTYGKEYYERYWMANLWISKYLPNASIHSVQNTLSNKKYFIKDLMERLLDNSLGNYLDKFFMKMTYRRWQKKYGQDYNKEDFSVAFKTRQNVSKSHPQFFQKKVLDSLEKKIQSFEEQFNVYLN